MLFRTVYGVELPAIYGAIQNGLNTREQLKARMLSSYADGRTVSGQSIDDALSFLHSVYLIDEQSALQTIELEHGSFALSLLHNLRLIQNGVLPPRQPIDALYWQILDEAFIKPDKLFVREPHKTINQMKSVAELGGISVEKVRSWQRVMTFVGLGRRISRGFQCAYSLSITREILQAWSDRTGNLQSFLEKHVDQYLPCITESGDIAQALAIPLSVLCEQGQITLEPRQDSPHKSYFGEQRIKHISYEG